MYVIEARQHAVSVDRHAVTRRLDHKDDGLIVDRQPVPALPVGSHNLATVRYQDAGNPGIARPARAGAGKVLEDHAGYRALRTLTAVDRTRRGVRWRCRGRRYGRRAALDQVPAR